MAILEINFDLILTKKDQVFFSCLQSLNETIKSVLIRAANFCIKAFKLYEKKSSIFPKFGIFNIYLHFFSINYGF